MKEMILIFEVSKALVGNQKFEFREDEWDMVNWGCLIEKLKEHRVLNSLYSYFERILPKRWEGVLEEQHFNYIAKCNLCVKELHRLLLLAEKLGFRPLLVKGFINNQLLYDSIYNRDTSDIDLLVPKNKIVEFYRLISERLGYKQQLYYNNQMQRFVLIDSAKIKYGDNFHELQCIREDIGISVEIKKSSSAIPIKISGDFFDHSSIYSFLGYEVVGLDQMHTFLHLLINAYMETEQYLGAYRSFRLREYQDIAIYLKKYCHLINWGECERFLCHYGMLDGAKRIFSNVKKLYGNSVYIPAFFLQDTLSGIKWRTSIEKRILDKEQQIRELNYLVKCESIKCAKNGKEVNDYIHFNKMKKGIVLCISRNYIEKNVMENTRLVISILNPISVEDNLVSDVYIKKDNKKTVIEYCQNSQVLGKDNIVEKYTCLEEDRNIKIVLKKLLLIEGKIYCKIFLQQSILGYFPRIMIDPDYEFTEYFWF